MITSCTAAAGSIFHFVHRHLAIHAVGDVVARSAKEEGFLFDNADVAAQKSRGYSRRSTPSSRIFPGYVVARQQIDQRGLARTRCAEQRHTCPGCTLKSTLQCRLIAAIVLKADISKRNSPRSGFTLTRFARSAGRSSFSTSEMRPKETMLPTLHNQTSRLRSAS